MYSAEHEKTYDYQLQLVNRRWQYFATYLFILGLFVNAIPDDIWKLQHINDLSSLPLLTIAVGMIFLGIVFTQLISLSTKRIERLEIFVGKTKTITGISLDGKYLGHSETTILYLTIYMFSIPWVIILLYNEVYAFLITTFLSIGNLFFLKWKSLVHPETNE